MIRENYHDGLPNCNTSSVLARNDREITQSSAKDGGESNNRRVCKCHRKTYGVVGDKFVSMKKGGERSTQAKDGSTLPSKEPFDLGPLMEKGSVLLNDFHDTVTDVRGRADLALDSITRT